jgi:hypothetical protein
MGGRRAYEKYALLPPIRPILPLLPVLALPMCSAMLAFPDKTAKENRSQRALFLVLIFSEIFLVFWVPEGMELSGFHCFDVRSTSESKSQFFTLPS